MLLERYLTPDNRLDYQSIWRAMSEIRGPDKQNRQEKLYAEVISAFEEYQMGEARSSHSRGRQIDTEIVSHAGLYDADEGESLTPKMVLDAVNRMSGHDFVFSDGRYCENGSYTAEIRIRDRSSPDCTIIYDNYDKNIRMAENGNREALYIVATNEDVHVFNLSRLKKKNYKFGWDWKETSDGVKFMGYLGIPEASVCYKNKS